MKKLGKFEIIEKVGQGAMGVVYKARDPFIDRIVALKTLTTGLADDANLLRRFYSEARSAGGLQHPNIVTIYELGHEGDTPFIAMQFLTGDSLDKILDRRPNLLLSQKIGFIVYVCRALEYAHKQNPPVVHRDIKPGNVMVTVDGAVVVVDFGIARLGEGTRSQSAGMLIGTLGYMSPQLFRNGAADARSDIWATGVMFYELLAFRRPFEGDNAAALMSNIILEKPRSLNESAPNTPADLQAVVDRMLAKDAEARYQSMEEVLMELEPIWRRVQQADVSDLLENTQQLFEAGNLDRAKSNISQINQIDPSNTLARSWAEKLSAALRQKEIGPRLKELVEKAERFLAEGRVEDAKAEVQAALGLDSTYQRAKEVLGQVKSVEERDRKIALDLRNSKQRMAEGALTEAELLLDKVLALDPGNAAARDQLKQIREERSRRERRKQRDEALHRARTLWTNLQYEECIALLLTAQKQFPGDSEITKLLESARQDQAEQQRQSLLTEARNLLSAQRFDDSLRALDRLLERYPSDATAKNLRIHALQGQEQQIRDQRLDEGKSKLRAWVKEEKYSEAISYAAQLSKEFPEDFELRELIEFARTELSQIEQKRRFEQYSKQIQLALKDGRFSEATKSAEKALLEFPKNLDLLILLDRAKKEQGEKEKHERLKRSLREIERMTERQEITDAINLARQTLAVVGQDSQLADTLIRLEREFEFREQKTRQQSETILQARTLFNSGKLTDATAILQQAIDTQLFSANDPQIAKLQNEIAAKKEPPPSPTAAAATATSGGAPSATVLIPPGSSTPSLDAGKDYVYQRGTPPPEELLTPERDAVASSFSPTPIGPSIQPVPPPTPLVIPPAPKKTEKKKQRQPERAPEPVTDSPTQIFSPTPGTGEVFSEIFAPEIEEQQPAADKRAPRKPATQKTVEPSPQPIPQPLWKNPLLIGALAIVLLASIGGILYAMLHNGSKVIPPTPGLTPAPEEQAVWDQAEQLMAATPHHFAEALSKYQGLVTPKSYFESKAQSRVQEIQRLQAQENDLMNQGAQAQGANKYDEALRDYQQAQRINGDREKEAEDAIKIVKRLQVGGNLGDIAKENFNRADSLLGQKQWGPAKSLYQMVRDTKEAPSELRKSAADKVLLASNHMEEEALWARAQEFRRNNQLKEARPLAQQVVTMNLDHRGEADNLIREIDTTLVVEAGAAEEKTFLGLEQQRSSAANNANELKTLVPKYEALAAGGGKHAQEALRIAHNEIPSAVEAIDRSARERELAERWKQTKTDCDSAVANKDTNSMNSVKARLNPFLAGGSFVAEAKVCLDAITMALKPPPPPPPVDPKPGINAALEALSRAFADRKIEEVKQVWTPMSKQQAETLKTSFAAAKSFSIKFTPIEITVNGDTALVTGIRAGTYDGGSQKTPLTGPFKAALRKQGDHWIITDFTM